MTNGLNVSFFAVSTSSIIIDKLFTRQKADDKIYVCKFLKK